MSVYQQLTEHEHHGMAVGHEYVDKTKVGNKGYSIRDRRLEDDWNW